MNDIVEKAKDLITDNVTDDTTVELGADVSDEILALKEQVASKYIDELKAQKESGISGLIIGKGDALKDYLVSEGIGDRVWDNIKGGFMDKFFTAVDTESFVINGVTYTSIFDYLKPLKKEFDDANTEAKLKALEDKILATPAVTPETPVAPEMTPATTVEYDDKTGRGKITAAMDALVEKDKAKDIPYVWGGESVTKEGGLDCSGMVDYVLTQAGVDFKKGENLSTRNTTREYFKESGAQLVLGKDEATTKEEGLALIKKEGRLKGLQKGDVLIRNGCTKAYKPKRSKLNYNNKNYYLHHIAMIESVDEEKGEIHTLESNGSQGVSECTRDIWERLHGSAYKSKASEFYVGKMNYDTYFEDASVEQTDQQVVTN